MTAREWLTVIGLGCFVMLTYSAMLTAIAAAAGDIEAVKMYFVSVAVFTGGTAVMLAVTR